MPSLDALQTAHVSTWRAISEEPRGKREKRWVQGAGAEWLRKEPRELRPTEPVVETLTLRLARAAGLQAAESQLATWLDDEKTVKYGIIVRRFLDTNFETLIEGIQLLGEDPVYNPEAHGEHTLERVRAAVAKREAAPGQLLQSLSDVLLFDAWIGNSDRVAAPNIASGPPPHQIFTRSSGARYILSPGFTPKVV